MSKMPSKKKSCFQITSVTQAQVAANSNADDTESLDDPDESTRTEDVSSSEMYDMSKGGDFEPEACDVSLSDEPLHNEVETSDATIPASRAVHINPNVRSVSGSAAPVSPQPTTSSQAASVSSSATVSSCSSRFRVIKLDHGTGEPFKRGRWTCTEFYERDTDASRTVESAKHTDHSMDKDVPGQVAADPHTDSGYASSNPPVEQTFGVPQQGLGLVSQNLFGDAHAQHVKSPSMPSITQPQPFYPKQTQKPGPIIQTVIASNQADFRPQHQPPGSPATSLPLVTPLTPNAHVLSVDRPIGQPEHVQGLLLNTALGIVPQTPAPLIQPAVTVSVGAHAAVQNVPVVMSSASNSMPKQTPGPVVPAQPQGVHSSSVVGLGAQTTLVNFSQLPIGIIPSEESQRTSDVLLGKDAVKPLNPEGLQLPTPAVNSLFGITIPIDGDDDRNPSAAFYQAFPNGRSKAISDGASGASVVAIDNKIEQAMDLVKSHLMYAVREEVEVLKEQIKELYERNSMLERENAVLKSLANTDQLTQLTTQIPNPGSTSPQQTPINAILQEGSKLVALPQQPNVSTA